MAKFDVDDALVRKLAGLLSETGLTEIEYEVGDQRIHVGQHCQVDFRIVLARLELGEAVGAVAGVDDDLAGEDGRVADHQGRRNVAGGIDDNLAEGRGLGVAPGTRSAAGKRGGGGGLRGIAGAEQHRMADAGERDADRAPHVAAADDPDWHQRPVRRRTQARATASRMASVSIWCTR